MGLGRAFLLPIVLVNTMPIAPNFTINQTDTHVLFEISVPHIRVTDVQVVLTDDNSVLHFASVPAIYLLVLNFSPHCFQEEEDEACNAKFDPIRRNGTVSLELRKSIPGHWDNLDLLGRLQQQTFQKAKSSKTTNWLLAVEQPSTEQSNKDNEDVTESNGSYGFARMFTGIFLDLTRDGLAREMLELPWNEEEGILVDWKDRQKIHIDRRLKRITMECEKFDSGRYLGDTFACDDDYLYQCAVEMKPHWEDSDGLKQPFDKTDSSLMLSIPYPLLPKNITGQHFCFPLVDILYAYVYDHVMTYGDPTVESAWTISILSASLSALEDWSDNATTRLVVESCIRRSLVYPYLRSFSLSILVAKHVASILRRGLRTVIRCFLHVRRILDRSELYYLGNKIFVDPYLAWLQNAKVVCEDNLSRLADEIDNIVADGDLKEGIGLNIPRIESAALEGCVDGESSSDQKDGSETSSSEGSERTNSDSDSVNEDRNISEGGLVAELSRLTINLG